MKQYFFLFSLLNFYSLHTFKDYFCRVSPFFKTGKEIARTSLSNTKYILSYSHKAITSKSPLDRKAFLYTVGAHATHYMPLHLWENRMMWVTALWKALRKTAK